MEAEREEAFTQLPNLVFFYALQDSQEVCVCSWNKLCRDTA